MRQSGTACFTKLSTAESTAYIKQCISRKLMGQGNSRADKRSATSPTSSHPVSDAAELLQLVQQRSIALEEARGEHVPDMNYRRLVELRRPRTCERKRRRDYFLSSSMQNIPGSNWRTFTSKLAGSPVFITFGTGRKAKESNVFLATRASRLRPRALTLLKRVVSASQREDVLQLQSAHRERGYVPAIPERSREEVTQALSANVSDPYAATWVLELENCCRAVDRLCEALKQSEPESTEFTKLSIVLAFVKAYFLLAFAIPGMPCGKRYLILRVCSGDVNLLCAELMTYPVDALKNIPTNAQAPAFTAPALAGEKKSPAKKPASKAKSPAKKKTVAKKSPAKPAKAPSKASGTRKSKRSVAKSSIPVAQRGSAMMADEYGESL